MKTLREFTNLQDLSLAGTQMTDASGGIPIALSPGQTLNAFATALRTKSVVVVGWAEWSESHRNMVIGG